jgi:hypothetical protein
MARGTQVHDECHGKWNREGIVEGLRLHDAGRRSCLTRMLCWRRTVMTGRTLLSARGRVLQVSNIFHGSLTVLLPAG